MDTILEQAKNFRIFQGLETSVIASLLNTAEHEKFAAGEIIIEQGDIPNGKGYIIESGSVDVWVNGDQTATLSQGDIFGEIALLNEEERSATVVAQSDINTLVLSQDTLFNMIENDNNTINKEIMRRMEQNFEIENGAFI